MKVVHIYPSRTLGTPLEFPNGFMEKIKKQKQERGHQIPIVTRIEQKPWYLRIADPLHDLVVSMLTPQERLLGVERCCRDWRTKSRAGRGWTEHCSTKIHRSALCISNSGFYSVNFNLRLQRFHALRSVSIGDVTERRRYNILMVTDLSALGRLESLSFYNCQLPYGLLYTLTSPLRSLAVASCSMTLDGVTRSGEADFRVLHIIKSAHKGRSDNKKWPFAASLESLHCQPYELCSKTDSNRLASFSNLTLLSFARPSGSDFFDPHVLKPLAGTLKTLRLRNCKPRGDSAFSGLGLLTNLTNLQLINTFSESYPITSTGFASLHTLNHLRSLTLISESNYHLPIEPLGRLVSLRQFHLGAETIDSAILNAPKWVPQARVEYQHYCNPDNIYLYSHLSEHSTPYIFHEKTCSHTSVSWVSPSYCNCRLPLLLN